jgi:hypothetical protein
MEFTNALLLLQRALYANDLTPKHVTIGISQQVYDVLIDPDGEDKHEVGDVLNMGGLRFKVTIDKDMP